MMKPMKNRSFLFAALLLMTQTAVAQKAWITPAENPNLKDSVTLWVDIKKCDRQQLAGSTEDLYMWTWKPNEHPVGHPLHNGTWNASNEALRWTSAGNDVYFYRMVPTEFYEVTPAALYANDIHLLLKKKDGTGDSNGEAKTEDLVIALDPPVTGPQKLSTFPKTKKKDTMSTSSSDVFTLKYDRNLEEKVALQTADDFYVYVQAKGDNGLYYKYNNISITKVGNDPNLAMSDMGNGMFHFTIIPSSFMAADVPAGVKLIGLKFQVVRKTIKNSDDTVDGTYEYIFNPNCE
jgi:hypothetical protein